MKTRALPTKSLKPSKPLSFTATLKNIATGMEYFALPIPAKVTAAVGTHGPVPVAAHVNESEQFFASLYPVGGGRHYLRVRNAICKSVGIQAGDRVRVKLTARDRHAKVALPKDLRAALRAAGAEKGFQAISLGKRSLLLRMITSAAKPETRAKRIREVVTEASLKKGSAAAK